MKDQRHFFPGVSPVAALGYIVKDKLKIAHMISWLLFARRPVGDSEIKCSGKVSPDLNQTENLWQDSKFTAFSQSPCNLTLMCLRADEQN